MKLGTVVEQKPQPVFRGEVVDARWNALGAHLTVLVRDESGSERWMNPDDLIVVEVPNDAA